MDPDQALKDALVALTRNPNAQTIVDLDDARESLAALADWIDGGGFLPRWPIDGPDLRAVIAATVDSTELVAQVTRVCWMLDAIDGSPESARRVLLAVNALRFTCGDIAELRGAREAG